MAGNAGEPRWPRFVRVSQEPILLKCEISQPNQIICLDESLFDPVEAGRSIAAGGLILINSVAGPEKFNDLRSGRLGLIEAGRIASQHGLGKMINTAVLGAYCRMNSRPGLEALLAAVEETVPAKKEANLAAVEEAHRSLRLERGGA